MVFSITAAICAAQDPKLPTALFAPSDVFVLPSMSFQALNSSGADELKMIAPGAFTANTAGYQQSSGRTVNGNSMFSAMIGFRMASHGNLPYRKNPVLRIGISYLTVQQYNVSFFKDVRVPYDTLYSLQTGQPIYTRDSIKSSSYAYSYSARQLRLDLSAIWRTDPAARWSVYGGLGIMAGISIRAGVDVTHTNNVGIETTDQQGQVSGRYTEGSHEYSFLATRPNSGYAGYIPLGIDWRIGSIRPFWKQLHLFVEARPGINVMTIPGIGSSANGFFQAGIGLRVTVGNNTG